MWQREVFTVWCLWRKTSQGSVRHSQWVHGALKGWTQRADLWGMRRRDTLTVQVDVVTAQAWTFYTKHTHEGRAALDWLRLHFDKAQIWFLSYFSDILIKSLSRSFKLEKFPGALGMLVTSCQTGCMQFLLQDLVSVKLPLGSCSWIWSHWDKTDFYMKSFLEAGLLVE